MIDRETKLPDPNQLMGEGAVSNVFEHFKKKYPHEEMRRNFAIAVARTPRGMPIAVDEEKPENDLLALAWASGDLDLKRYARHMRGFFYTRMRLKGQRVAILLSGIEGTKDDAIELVTGEVDPGTESEPGITISYHFGGDTKGKSEAYQGSVLSVPHAGGEQRILLRGAQRTSIDLDGGAHTFDLGDHEQTVTRIVTPLNTDHAGYNQMAEFDLYPFYVGESYDRLVETLNGTIEA